MKRLKRKHILLFIVLFLVLACIIYLVPGLTGALHSTYRLEYGTLEVADETDGYFVRNERVYFTSVTGREERLVKEGALVKKGTRVIAVDAEVPSSRADAVKDREGEEKPEYKFRRIRQELKGTGVWPREFKTEEEGVVSYHADGMEGKYTPEVMKEMKYSDFKGFDNGYDVPLKRNRVIAKDPVFKVVDRADWYIVCYVPGEHKDRYQKGDSVSIDLEGRKSIFGSVYHVSDEDTRCKVILRTNYYYKGFATQRVAEVKLITSQEMGLIIRNTSITEKKGSPGVFVRQKNGGYKFVRINVIATDGEKSVVSRMYFLDEKGNTVETVKNYDEVLKRA